MLDHKEFDLWADEYDNSVDRSQEAGEYPFAGYQEVLDGIYKTILKKEKGRILDIGFGTGTLTKRLYDDGYEIYGIDFSEKMIEIAEEKMPEARLICYDFTKGLPEELMLQQFDFIICTYAIHHLTEQEKAAFITQLLKCLNFGGEILIGDVAFETREELMKCKEKYKDIWDTDEIYLVFDELKQSFPMNKCEFLKKSHCAGIVAIRNC